MSCLIVQSQRHALSTLVLQQHVLGRQTGYKSIYISIIAVYEPTVPSHHHKHTTHFWTTFANVVQNLPVPIIAGMDANYTNTINLNHWVDVKSVVPTVR